MNCMILGVYVEMDALQRAIEEMKAKTAREYIAVHAEPCTDMTVYQSKFGGVPYLPAGFPYPQSKLHPEQPLRLLAQLNFAEMPHLGDFPEAGILQIYIEPDDDRFFGCDERIAHFENIQLENQSAFRILFHEAPDMSAPVSGDIPDFDGEFLVEQPERLTFEKKTGYMPYTGSGDDAFHEAFMEIYNQYAENPLAYAEELPDIAGYEYAAEKQFCCRPAHQIGGYQADIWDAKWMHTEVLLLQIASDSCINWGDDGIAHFTMSLADLKQRDFSRVSYTWECY